MKCLNALHWQMKVTRQIERMIIYINVFCRHRACVMPIRAFVSDLLVLKAAAIEGLDDWDLCYTDLEKIKPSEVGQICDWLTNKLKCWCINVRHPTLKVHSNEGEHHANVSSALPCWDTLLLYFLKLVGQLELFLRLSSHYYCIDQQAYWMPCVVGKRELFRKSFQAWWGQTEFHSCRKLHTKPSGIHL